MGGGLSATSLYAYKYSGVFMKKYNVIRFKLFLVIGLFYFIFIPACTTTVNLSRSPSDLVLVSIVPNNTDVIAYSTDSKINEPFEHNFTYGPPLTFPINAAYKNNIDSYIQTKFSKIINNTIKDDSTIILKFVLNQFTIQNKIEQNTGETLSSLFGNEGPKGNLIIDVKMTVSVQVSKNGKMIAEKNILSTSSYNEFLKPETVESMVYQKAVNEGLSKCIIMVDKFLVSLNL